MLYLVFENMVGMFAGFENFDELINRAISECGIHSQSSPSLGVEKEQEETKILETLPEDFCYKFNNLSANGQKSSFSTGEITTENLDRWLTEFQTIDSISLKIKTKKKPTNRISYPKLLQVSTPEDGVPAKILRGSYILIQQQG